MKQVFKKEEEVKEVKPYRLQYSLKEAAYMLCSSENTVKYWCEDYLYKIDGRGHNFIKHDDLVGVIEKRACSRAFCDSILGGKKSG